jgi:hypothetical protein
MRKIFLISFLFISFLAKAQQYTNFQGYGFKANRLWADSVSIQPSDTVINKVAKSVAILNNKLYVADGTKWIIAGGGAVDTFSLSTRAWRQKGIDSVVGLLNNISVDSFIYSTRAWRQKGIDSVQANLNSGLSAKLNISDTALMLIPYLRKADTITLSNRIDARVKYTDTASMLSPYSKLKSVGLTMPSAFNVANSPLTSDGTLAVSGAGTAAQYVRGDGQLANFPSNGGGGSSVNYYLNGSVNQGTFGGTTYYEMSKTPILGAGTNFTINANGYIASFITDAGDPSLLNIPGGNWNLEFYFNSSSAGGSPNFYAELYKVSSSNVFTLIASGSANPEGITNGTTVDQYYTSISVPQTSLLVTDRIAIRIFVNHSSKTITLHTENSNLSEVLTTFSTGLNALNGLTSQVQYFATGTSGTDFNISSATDTHTFNLPTASATNRGALSTTDWTTFNGKLGTGDTATMLTPYSRGSGTSGQVGYWNATRSLTGSSNLFWDNANNRLGVGTNAPNSAFQINSNIAGTAQTKLISVNDITTTDYSNAAFFNSNIATTRLGFVLSNSSSTNWVNNHLAILVTGASHPNNNYFTNISGKGNDAGYGMIIGQGNQTTGLLIGTYGSNPVYLGTNNNARMSIFSNGNVGIGTTTDAGYKLDVNGTARVQNKLSVGTPSAASAVMEITSTTQGFLPPRMTTTQKNAISSPATGLMVYDTTLNKLCVFTGTVWETITSL